MRYRLLPTDDQAEILLGHCATARFVGNLAVEQWRCGPQGRTARSERQRRGRMPGVATRGRQLTEIRATYRWLAEGVAQIQQQALRDFQQAVTNFYSGTHRPPKWRKKGDDEGFRVVNADRQPAQRLNRHFGQVYVPKVGWVRFGLTRPIPKGVKSFRVTFDRSGRWHVAFALKPEPIEGPGDGSIVGIDRGVVIPCQVSDGRAFDVPGLTAGEQQRKHRLEQQMARRQAPTKTAPGSARWEEARIAVARLWALEADRRKDAIDKATTELALTVDLIRLEDLRVKQMTKSAKGTVQKPGKNIRQKAGLNRGILSKSWSMFARRLEDNAPGRVELVPASYTSQECPECHHVDKENRKSQAVFACARCGLVANADLVGAINTARRTPGGSARSPRGTRGVETRIQPAA